MSASRATVGGKGGGGAAQTKKKRSTQRIPPVSPALTSYDMAQDFFLFPNKRTYREKVVIDKWNVWVLARLLGPLANGSVGAPHPAWRAPFKFRPAGLLARMRTRARSQSSQVRLVGSASQLAPTVLSTRIHFGNELAEPGRRNGAHLEYNDDDP